jgi:two-component system cell cycle sensor histidine kinase/response regulator CckA
VDEAASERRIEELERRLSDAAQTIRALIDGEVDSLLQPDSSTPLLLQAAQERLTANERLLEDSQAVAHLGSWMSPAEPGGPIVWSVECARLFGLPHAPAPTIEAFMATVHPDDVTAVVAASERAAAAGTPCETEHRIVRPSGEVRWVASRTVTQGTIRFGDGPPRTGEDAQGRSFQALGIIQDITERRIADEAQSRLASLVSSSDDAIISRGTDGIIQTWNRGAERLMLYSAAEAIGMPISNLYIGRQVAELGRLRALIDGGGFVDQFEMAARRKDGSEVEVSVRSSVLTDSHGVVRGASIIARDISERRKAEAALRRSEEQLRQSQKMDAIGSLAGGVAHDFNNILSVILSYSTLLIEDLRPGDPTRLDLEEIHKAGIRASALTKQLLSFSRQQMLAPVVLDLNEVISGLEKMLNRLLREDIQLTFLADPRAGKVVADQGQIEQVVMNLVVNARDAMPRGGSVTIETSSVVIDEAYAAQYAGMVAGPYVSLIVSDTGCGMDAATKARIFEPFFTTKGEHKGTGLGLATVYGIVQQSGGHIWVYSEPAKGSAFKVYLPRTERRLESRAPPGERLSSLEGAETILLVEDEEQVRVIVRTILRKHGYHVLEAQNGGEAFLLCEQFGGRIDLLLTDVVMPRMSGSQVAERLVKVRPDLRVLFMSGYAADTIVHHGVLDAGLAFLQKPIMPVDLLRRVRDVLDARDGRK